MSRIAIPTVDQAPSAARPLLDAVHAQLGVALNVLTNYVNNVVRTDVDFPRVDLRAAA